MNGNWAAAQLQTIRTLMERSALYRRALAPISIFAGAAGILAAIAGVALKIEVAGAFAAYWMAVAAVTIAGSFFLVRRQAVRQGEFFWSPPLRRVAQAMFPPLLVGLVLGLVVIGGFWQLGTMVISLLLIFWTLLFGLALHAAGFFMPRGVHWFGCGFIATGIAMMPALFWNPFNHLNLSPHWVMGVVFGGFHLAYGVYLHFSEQRIAA
jgi:hypothetical protein